MLRTARPASFRVLFTPARSIRHATGTGSGSLTQGQSHPNAPLDLDPTFRALLKDVDMSLVRHKSRNPPRVYRELEALPTEQALDDNVENYDEESCEDEIPGRRDARKSPAADYGSQQIGAIVLPLELQKCITHLIAGKKRMLCIRCILFTAVM
jgi:hypothetical protein